MRVIAGRLRGRRLHAAPGRALRPTADRVREAVFSILGDAVRGASVLDLYAGTGALAIEALSRGAIAATCVERDPRSLTALERNLTELGLADRVTVVQGEALDQARKTAWDGSVYDLVFCDPPYRLPLDPLRSALLETAAWTRAVVLEHAAAMAPPAAPEGVLSETRRYGDTAITLYWRP